MAEIRNSHGLLVQVDEGVPTTSGTPWGRVFYTGSTLAPMTVTPVLEATVQTRSGRGTFPLEGKVLGIRGSIQVSYLTGPANASRTLVCLTDQPTNPVNSIVLGLDALNRPYLVITDAAGSLKAQVSPTFAAVPASSQVTLLMSWDSTQAIDGTRFALFETNQHTALSAADWMTNPVTSWTSFIPTHLLLCVGVGGDDEFNGTVSSVQISNDTVSPTTSGQFPTNRVFDRFPDDAIASTTADVITATT